MALTNRANFGDLLEPGFNKIYNDAFQEIPQLYPSLLNIKTSDKQDERESAVTGFSQLSQVAEGASITYEDPVQMYDVVYRHLKFALGFKITREMYDDDLYNVMNSKPRELGLAANRTEEQSAANIFINGFSTSYLGGDGVPLLSTVHPSSAGQASQSNASATSVKLTEDNLEVGILALRNQKDDKGQKKAFMANTLLVPVASPTRKDAHIIVDAPLRSGTADNDPNVYKGTLTVKEWIYLSSSTAWFLIDSSMHKINWFWRKRPSFAQDTVFDTQVALYATWERFSNGFSDWRGVWGSKGDATAYSS